MNRTTRESDDSYDHNLVRLLSDGNSYMVVGSTVYRLDSCGRTPLFDSEDTADMVIPLHVHNGEAYLLLTESDTTFLCKVLDLQGNLRRHVQIPIVCSIVEESLYFRHGQLWLGRQTIWHENEWQSTGITDDIYLSGNTRFDSILNPFLSIISGVFAFDYCKLLPIVGECRWPSICDKQGRLHEVGGSHKVFVPAVYHDATL
jgi:hypothetical protein